MYNIYIIPLIYWKYCIIQHYYNYLIYAININNNIIYIIIALLITLLNFEEFHSTKAMWKDNSHIDIKKKFRAGRAAAIILSVL